MSPLKPVLACLGSAGALLLATLAAGLSGPPPSARAAAPPVGLILQVVPGQDGTGTIKGRLVWGGSEIPKAAQLKADKDTQVCGVKPLFSRELAIDAKTKGMAYAFAYVSSPKGKNASAEKALPKEVVIDQKGCEFLPYSTVMFKNQELVFKSSDNIGHNARYSGFSNGTKNVALPPNGQYKTKLVAEKRPLTLNCDIHPWMKGWIMVLDHPFFAVTKEDGSFEIQGVPAGNQNLVVWQEKVGYVTPGAAKGQAVTVKAGGTTDVGNIVLDPSKVKK